MTDRSRPRLFVLQALVVALLLTLFGRLSYLQVAERDDYAQQAATNRTRDVVTPAPRGEVYDSRGRTLIQNRTALVVSVNTSLLRRLPGDGAAVLARLAPVIGMPVDVLTRTITPCGETLPDGRKARATEDGCWIGSPYQPIPVATYDATDRKALARVLLVEENREDFPGVTTDFRAVRDYPRGTLAAHVLGYLGPIAQSEVGGPGFEDVQDTALIGRGGVEQVYEPRLRGKDGIQKLLVDKDGAVTGVAGETQPQAGDKLVLSLDAEVQALAERELKAAIDKARARPYYRGGLTKADSGSIVVMEAKTGRVVALASYPSYDPSQFTGGISDADYKRLIDEKNGQPLLFRATQGAYAPASTFKVISSTAAVMNGQTTFSSVMACPGRFAPTGQQNFEGRGSASVTLRRAIVQSCDTNFYKFAYDAWLRDGGIRPVAKPKDPMITMALRFGLGSRTGVDLPSESPGLIPTRQWRQDYWDSLKDDFCKGAVNPAFDAERRARNKDSCVDGFRFRGGQATNFAIGQGETLVTPLQLATVYAAVANGGTLVTPTLAKGFLSVDGTLRELITPANRGRVPVAPSVLAQLRDALHGVTSEPGGTGRRSFAGLPLSVAGKTGTGEVNGKQDTSWFASFAPYENPQLVVVGTVSQGGTGATTAAPMVRKVYEGIFGLGGKPALLPGGRSPATLPVARADGTVGPR
jgi:penicillin-binding protein 2